MDFQRDAHYTAKHDGRTAGQRNGRVKVSRGSLGTRRNKGLLCGTPGLRFELLTWGLSDAKEINDELEALSTGKGDGRQYVAF